MFTVVTGWDGQPTLLSKHLDETKRQPEKTREEILDEELDQGKVWAIMMFIISFCIHSIQQLTRFSYS